MAERRDLPTRVQYRHFLEIRTRWGDNDAYGHVNNAVYYSWFETAVSRFLIQVGEFGDDSAAIVVAVENGCRYFSPVRFPEAVTVGLRVGAIGNTSVRYEGAVFREDDDAASAAGFFVLVCVDRLEQHRKVAVPASLRAALAPLVGAEG